MNEWPLRYGLNPTRAMHSPASSRASPGWKFSTADQATSTCSMRQRRGPWRAKWRKRPGCRVLPRSNTSIPPARQSHDRSIPLFGRRTGYRPATFHPSRPPMPARGGDRVASFGDFIGLSEPADESCARLIAREVSDGIIAPGYSAGALEILRKKRGGAYLILRADPGFESGGLETRGTRPRTSAGCQPGHTPSRALRAVGGEDSDAIGSGPRSAAGDDHREACSVERRLPGL
jgi:hypothetical protein